MEKCQHCGRHYETIYRVPDDVWKQIAPQKDQLGDYPGYQYGGLLCVDCAWKAAKKFGICLYFNATIGWW